MAPLYGLVLKLFSLKGIVVSLEYLNFYVEETKKILLNLDLEKIHEIQITLVKCALQGGKIFICGNGGSASTAGHLAVDLNKGAFERTNIKFRSLSLAEHVASITAISNDLDYSSIFIHQFETFSQKGDVLLCISASGNSSNVLKVANFAKDNGHKVIGLTGFDGGELSKFLDLELNIESNHMGVIEDMHMMACHMIAFGIGQ
jgi:D-sedoheptulose 7-phosphate isomerase